MESISRSVKLLEFIFKKKRLKPKIWRSNSKSCLQKRKLNYTKLMEVRFYRSKSDFLVEIEFEFKALAVWETRLKRMKMERTAEIWIWVSRRERKRVGAEKRKKKRRGEWIFCLFWGNNRETLLYLYRLCECVTWLVRLQIEVKYADRRTR